MHLVIKGHLVLGGGCEGTGRGEEEGGKTGVWGEGTWDFLILFLQLSCISEIMSKEKSK